LRAVSCHTILIVKDSAEAVVRGVPAEDVALNFPPAPPTLWRAMVVLDRPEIPLSTNGSERMSAIRSPNTLDGP
jgi:hypothetical protein